MLWKKNQVKPQTIKTQRFSFLITKRRSNKLVIGRIFMSKVTKTDREYEKWCNDFWGEVLEMEANEEVNAMTLT